jgi:hypothetical protein
LIQEYTNAATELSGTLTELHLRSVAGQEEQGRLQNIVSKRGLELEQARTAFEDHTSGHGC